MVKLATFRNVSSPKFSIQKYEKISKEENEIKVEKVDVK